MNARDLVEIPIDSFTNIDSQINDPWNCASICNFHYSCVAFDRSADNSYCMIYRRPDGSLDSLTAKGSGDPGRHCVIADGSGPPLTADYEADLNEWNI